MPIILATSNQGKIKELTAILAPQKCISQQELNINSVAETGSTFIENAIIKARHVSKISKSPALADDSGLVVPDLNGEPGIVSARYAGPNASDDENIQKLLQKINTHKLDMPDAYFYCAMVLIQYASDPTPIVATGKLHGKIITKPTGKYGFGYDPIFFLKKYNCTLAELPSSTKNSISHRALALNNLAVLNQNQ